MELHITQQSVRVIYRSTSGYNASPVFGKSQVRFLLGFQVFSLSHTPDMMNVASFSINLLLFVLPDSCVNLA